MWPLGTPSLPDWALDSAEPASSKITLGFRHCFFAMRYSHNATLIRLNGSIHKLLHQQ